MESLEYTGFLLIAFAVSFGAYDSAGSNLDYVSAAQKNSNYGGPP